MLGSNYLGSPYLGFEYHYPEEVFTEWSPTWSWSVNVAYFGDWSPTWQWSVANATQHTTDSSKSKALIKTHTTDAFKRIGTAAVHSTSSNKKKLTTVAHNTDALSRSLTSRSYNTDSNKRKVTLSIHTTDASRRVAGNTKLHTTDSFKYSSNTTSHTIDSNKRRLLEVLHRTSAYRRTGFEQSHTTDALRLGLNTLYHSTDIYTGYDDYSRDDLVSLPINDNTLATRYTGDERNSVAVDDNTTYVPQVGARYLVHEFKHKNTTTNATITPICNLKTTLAPTIKPVYLQIFNQISGLWENIAMDNTTAANTDFTLTQTVSTNVSNYYTASGWVTCRVYQEAN